MTPEVVLVAINQGLYLTVILILVLLVPALLIGLFISMLQAATGIQEMTLSFIPKMLVVLGTLAIAGPWLLSSMTDFTRTLIEQIPTLIGL